jgi:Holliday junction resolvase-like predicted endonuclease
MNTRQQGDLGELSALEWLGHRGAAVYVPVGHSPDVDLVAWWEGRFVGVQVKTTTCFRNERWCPMVATRGGNQSWNRVAKHFDASRCDYLFVLVGDGRRWFIPSDRVDATTGLALGGPKYAAFEVESGRPILAAVA